MKEKEIAYIYSYLISNEISLEDDMRRARNNLRYRSIDISDCLDLLLLIERYNTFMEISSHIRSILKMFDKKGLFNYD